MSKLVKGSVMPDYTVDSVYGREVVRGTSISKIMNGKPTMFWFQRYIGCPPCRLDVHLLVVNYEKFLAKGVEVVVVMQSKPETVLKDMVDQSLPFHLICDPTESLYHDLEILSAENGLRMDMSEEDQKKMAMKAGQMKAEPDKYAHGEYEGNEQQLPAWFYVDKDMTVLEAHYAKNIADMPLAEEALAKI